MVVARSLLPDMRARAFSNHCPARRAARRCTARGPAPLHTAVFRRSSPRSHAALQCVQRLDKDGRDIHLGGYARFRRFAVAARNVTKLPKTSMGSVPGSGTGARSAMCDTS